MKANSRIIRRILISIWLRLMDWMGYQKEEFLVAINGHKWKRLVEEYDQYLRQQYKYHENEEAGRLREVLRDMMNDEQLNLE